MPMIPVPNCGASGVVKDLSKHELPLGAWSDASNVRFLDGYAQQFLGHGPAYGAPSVTPYHVLAVQVSGQRYWLYAGAQKIYATTIMAGTPVHTNLTRQTGGTDVNYAMVPNQITSTLLSGIPIINPGNLSDPPQQWNLSIATRMKVLDNWPANTFCKSLRAYKVYLIALNVTKAGVNYPYMVKWSSPADPGGVPITWDPADPTNDAGEYDLAETPGQIIDGLTLRDAFIIYKEDSIWSMTPSGNAFIFNFRKVDGTSGALNRNCIADMGQFHVVLTGQDVIVHDGQTATSILDKQARRALFDDFDVSATDRAFVVKNPFFNEAWICYASVGNSIPNKAVVWNYVDRTVSYRDIPAAHHANFGTVDGMLGDSWAADNDSWDSDRTKWNGPDAAPNTARVLMASNEPALYLIDTSSTFNGAKPFAFLERVGLSLGSDERRKLILGIRPRITGTLGGTVTVEVGGSNDPYIAPTYGAPMTYTIGETLKCDCTINVRYMAIRFSSGTASFWRMDSYDIDAQDGGGY